MIKHLRDSIVLTGLLGASFLIVGSAAEVLLGLPETAPGVVAATGVVGLMALLFPTNK